MRKLEQNSPADWSAAWRADGEVVLPYRRSSIWWRAVLFGILLLNSSLILQDNLHDRDTPAAYLVVMAITIPCWAWLFGYTVWQLITRRYDGNLCRLPLPQVSPDEVRPFAVWLRTKLDESRGVGQR